MQLAALRQASTALAAWSPVNAADPAYAGGGGSSTLYARPGWQPIPAQLAAGAATRKRFLPDLALPTAIDSGFNPGLAFCLSSSTAFLRLHPRAQRRQRRGHCHLCRRRGSYRSKIWSAGQSCARSLRHQPHRDGVFNDVEQGTAQLPCVAGSSGCGASGQIGYSAASGYDLATGLGVPDVQQAGQSLRDRCRYDASPPTSRSPFRRRRRITPTIRRRLLLSRRRSSIPPERAFPRAR